MPFILSDDGTLDTVVKCEDCGHEERFSFSSDGPDRGCGHNTTDDEGCSQCYADFVEWAKFDAAETHDCPRKQVK